MSLRPIVNNQLQDICPNVHVYIITKSNCPACVKFKSGGELDKILNYLKGKTTTSVHDASMMANDSRLPQEIKDNIMWAPMIVVQISGENGNQYGIFNGEIKADGTVIRQVKYPWNRFDSTITWLCDTIPKQYCNDNNICLDSAAYTKNPFYM